MFVSLIRLLKFAIIDFTRNVWLSTTTVVILTLTLLSAHILTAVNLAGATALTELESRVDVRVQFLPVVSEAEVDGFRLRFQERPEVAGVEQRARAQVLAEFQATHQTDDEVIEALTELGENPFGPELRIRLRRPEDFPVIVKFLEDPALAERIAETDTANRRELTHRLTALTSRLRVSGIAITGVFATITLLIIVNAMRIATYTRREEAVIMKLVGAPNWFIRTPFLIMGVLAAAIATALAQAITLPALRALAPLLVDLLGPRGIEVVAFFRSSAWIIAGVEFLALSLLTVVVSALAIRRYLRV